MAIDEHTIDEHSLIDTLKTHDPQESSTDLKHSLLLGFDTETTGARPGKDAIVSATLVLRDPESGHEGDMAHEWVINPHQPMTPGASRVNGFTDAYLREHGSEPENALRQIAAIVSTAQNLNIPLLAYNAPFDVSMLEGDLSRWNLPALQDGSRNDMLVVDPLVIDRAVSKRHGKRTLTDTTEYYGVEPQGDFHNATADTVAAIDLIEPMTTLYPQISRITIGELMSWQRNAYEEWKTSFNRWLAGRGRSPIRDTWV